MDDIPINEFDGPRNKEELNNRLVAEFKRREQLFGQDVSSFKPSTDEDMGRASVFIPGLNGPEPLDSIDEKLRGAYHEALGIPPKMNANPLIEALIKRHKGFNI